jgi:hypothetical protein
MKNVRLLLSIATIVLLTNSQSVFAQGVASCKVISMPGFPTLPTDSAYEGQTYSYIARVVNATSFFINTSFEIQLKVDSIEATIFSNPQPAIAPNDSVDVVISGYNFSQPQYKVGNNIVVVWPRFQNAPAIPVDTFYTTVFFIPLNSLSDGILNINELYFNSFPVPATDFINFEISENKLFDYVRIISISGQVVQEQKQDLSGRIYIGNLPAGNYFVETGLNGKRYRSKFIKQ